MRTTSTAPWSTKRPIRPIPSNKWRTSQPTRFLLTRHPPYGRENRSILFSAKHSNLTASKTWDGDVSVSRSVITRPSSRSTVKVESGCAGSSSRWVRGFGEILLKSRHWDWHIFYSLKQVLINIILKILIVLMCDFYTGTHYTWRKVPSIVHNIMFGKLWIDQEGEMDIYNHSTGEICHIKYNPSSFFKGEAKRVRLLNYIIKKMRQTNNFAHIYFSAGWRDHLRFGQTAQIMHRWYLG